jgi:hypothetical protein
MHACLLGSTLVHVIIAAACSALDSFTSVSSLWRYVWVAQGSRVTFSALGLSCTSLLVTQCFSEKCWRDLILQAGRVTLSALGLSCTSLLVSHCFFGEVLAGSGLCRAAGGTEIAESHSAPWAAHTALSGAG